MSAVSRLNEDYAKLKNSGHKKANTDVQRIVESLVVKKKQNIFAALEKETKK